VSTYVWRLLSIWAVDLMALVSPGPNFLLVTQTAMQRSRRCALAVALGIASGTAIWGTAVAAGLSSLFSLLPWIYTALKIAGAAYLIYLGIQLWRTAEPTSGDVSTPSRRSLGTAYTRGLLTNLLNPKSAAYYGSVFALFFPPDTPAWVVVAAVMLISITSVVWHTGVAALFSTNRVQRAYLGFRCVVNRAAGTVMAIFGVRLLLARD
jgi:threonine efflux protein